MANCSITVAKERRTRTGSAAVVGGGTPRMGSTGLPLEVALASDWMCPYDVVEAVVVHRTSRRRPAARAWPNPGDTEMVAEPAAVVHMPVQRDRAPTLGLPSAQGEVAAVAVSEQMCGGGHCGLVRDCEVRTAQIQKDSLDSRLRSLRS